MRGKSHHILGKYLLQHHMPHLPRQHAIAFLIGCVEPDKNPFTYLKGSFRCQWLCGHNYRNARRFMRYTSQRLEQKKTLNLSDYYRLGKLIHYTADAFTYAHNDTFNSNLGEHRAYEADLQNYFLSYLADSPSIERHSANSIMEIVASYHRRYIKLPANIQTDCRFVLAACCGILSQLFCPKFSHSGAV